MLIKVLKSGRYAHPEPCHGIKTFREGEEIDVDPKLGTAMLCDQWAELPDEPVPAKRGRKK